MQTSDTPMEDLHKDPLNEAPLLRELRGKGSGMSVPEGYFEATRAELGQTIPDTSAAVRKLPLKWYFAAAASLAIAFGAVFLWSSRESIEMRAEVSQEELWESDAFFLAASEAIYDMYESDFSENTDDDIINYLVFEDISIQLILEELTP
ncbi:MAG: hypothetical protein EA392_00840 [Cryomorphaceae bacterium]|nr:MAG: hypothetical protein EA392_00840 [Cryomorphaceae bacterium]